MLKHYVFVKNYIHRDRQEKSKQKTGTISDNWYSCQFRDVAFRRMKIARQLPELIKI